LVIPREHNCRRDGSDGSRHVRNVPRLCAVTTISSSPVASGCTRGGRACWAACAAAVASTMQIIISDRRFILILPRTTNLEGEPVSRRASQWKRASQSTSMLVPVTSLMRSHAGYSNIPAISSGPGM
jgi:hypothetical protein